MTNFIAERYRHLPGDANHVIHAICQSLHNPAGAADWQRFTPADWDLLVHMARQEGIAPLLHQQLSTNPAVPEAVKSALASVYFTNLSRNIRILHELDRVLACLQESGIPVVLLKGAAYAQTLYENIGQRAMGDVDLLLPAEQCEQAARLAQGLGYRVENLELAEGINDGIQKHILLVGPDFAPFSLELHFSLIVGPVSNFKPSLDWFWSQVEPLHAHSHENEPAAPQVLNPTAALLFQCAHAFLQHGEPAVELRWLVDADRLARTGRVDWSEVCAKAVEWKWADALERALTSMQDLLGTPIPEGVLSGLKQVTGGASPTWTDMPAPTRFAGQWRQIKLIAPGLRLRLLAALVFPSRSFMLARYRPKVSWLWPFYYPYRWLYVAADMLKTAWKVLQTLLSHQLHPER